MPVRAPPGTTEGTPRGWRGLTRCRRKCQWRKPWQARRHALPLGTRNGVSSLCRIPLEHPQSFLVLDLAALPRFSRTPAPADFHSTPGRPIALALDETRMPGYRRMIHQSVRDGRRQSDVAFLCADRVSVAGGWLRQRRTEALV